MSQPTATISLPSLERLSSGKVRDLFLLPSTPDRLLFVASDRISAYDVVLDTPIPLKGAVLTLTSAHWFNVLPSLVPGLKTHFLTLDLPAGLPEEERIAARHRAMQVRKLKIFPVEAIVRGYLTGSAWKEYQTSGTVHSIKLPAGLRLCDRLPEPLYTPSTKAEQGAHDENIHPDEAARIIGDPALAARVESLALDVYNAAAAYAAERGIIIADTKFEFGLDEATGEVILVDEVLTPDSSRFWPADKYEVGREQESFDKQFVRDWLVREGLKGKDGVAIPDDIAKATGERYRDVFERLTGQKFEDALKE
ncbi:phosphoribosylaminoimidazole-succinocarboxamide synthase [Plectosphaerella plurivora]|uniref:Phosphoribosylaminoimidazole-succinocarboxamide synthase n=1 Tax=Plectosphaerella plurivora TaxID=936078 RepID=A0A9P8VBP8_9PEZI|nr:phosphoribosylaminoimidazole-succinocarboxamide synthase [Plectosphaerella plurivora]